MGPEDDLHPGLVHAERVKLDALQGPQDDGVEDDARVVNVVLGGGGLAHDCCTMSGCYREEFEVVNDGPSLDRLPFYSFWAAQPHELVGALV